MLFGGLVAGGLRDPLTAAIFAAAIWILWLRGSQRLSWAALAPWLPWLAWAALGAAVSAQPLKCLYPLSRWSTVIAFFILIRGLWGAPERKLWFEALCAVSAIVGLAALWAGWGELMAHGSGEVMTGLIPPYYNYSIFVEAAAASAIFAALGHPDGPKGKARWVLWGLASFLIVIIAVARARAGLLAVLAAAALSVWRRGGARRFFAAASLAAIAAVVLTAGVMFFHGVSADFFLKPDKALVAKRPQIWRAALEVAADHPVIGEGIGNFAAGFLRHNFKSNYRLTNYQMRTDFAHSEPLNLAAETGLIGLVLFLSALWLSIAVPRRAEASWTQEAALGAAAAMGVQCLVDNMLHMPGLAYLFFSALAVSQTRPAMSAVSGMPVWGKLAAVGGLFLALVAWIPAALIQRYTGMAQNTEDPQRRLEWARRAARIHPADAALREDLARAFLAQTPPRVDEALEELSIAWRLNPTNAIYPVMSAELLRARREWPRVLEFSEEALRLEPNFLQARLLRAEVLARQGKKAAARAELAEVRRRRADMEKALLYTGNRALYNGYDFTVGAYDEARVDLVSRLLR